MKFGHLIPYVLPSQAYSASGTATSQLKDLPKRIFGRIAHLVAITFALAFTPTYSSGTGTQVGNHNAVRNCDIWDGKAYRFVGGFNALRAKNRLATGAERVPLPDTDTASATARYMRHTWDALPLNFQGAPSDGAIACANLVQGEVRYTFGALADIDANCTACTGSLRIIAWLMLLDEIRIPPAYQFQALTASAADVPIPGRAAFDVVALLNSASYDAITAGDFGAIRFDLGYGDIIPSVNSQDLTAAYQHFIGKGEVGVFQGDQAAASDDNGKVVNHGTPTALVASPVDLQVILHSGPQSMISKLEVADVAARLQWSGTQTTGVVLYGRILPQDQSVRATNMVEALSILGAKQKGFGPKTLSKKGYNGPKLDFFPFVVKV